MWYKWRLVRFGRRRTVYGENQPKFFLGWFNSYTHDSPRQAAYLDEPITTLLKSMIKKGYLNNTITILMGDHGNRYVKNFRATIEGRIDHRTPLLAIVPPLETIETGEDQLRWETLRSNVNKLTSQLDLHATLWDILKYHTPKDPADNQVITKGQSLFTPILPRRTCKDAGIPTFYCVNANWASNTIPMGRLKKLGKKFVRFLNDYQIKFFKGLGVDKSPCKTRTLGKVENGGILEEGKFFMTLYVSPLAQFELGGTFEGDLEKVQFSVEDMARLDQFGEPPTCLDKYPESPEKKIMETLCACVPEKRT